MVKLIPMTKELCHNYFMHFENDPQVYEDPSDFQYYIYSVSKVDAYWKRQLDPGRLHLAIMDHECPVGEIILKKIDRIAKSCTMSIHLQNDRVKNRGIGTRAEILALEFAFETMGMKTVYADALLTNTRSRHVLKKVGFQETGSDSTYAYYRCDHIHWTRPEIDL